MKGLPSVRGAAYSDICEHFEQRMGNPQWKGFPQFAATVDLIRVFLIEKLQKKLGKGVGNLIGNSKYRKWVKVDDANVAALDIEAIEAQESRLDGVRGIFTSLSTEASQASAIKARYAELWRIEHGFRVLKSDLRMRPIFH